MKCKRCGINEATIYVTKNINGIVTKDCLCSNCAESMNIYDGFEKEMNKMFNIGNRFFDDKFFTLKNSLNDFFPSVNLLSDENKICSKERRYKVKRKNKEINSIEEKIKKLKESLELAIKEERYEDAAKIRDEIKKSEERR